MALNIATARFDMRRDAERLQALDFAAFDSEENLESLTPRTGAKGLTKRAQSAIGELMRGVFGYDSIEGGEGSMRLVAAPAGKERFFRRD
ncbi:MAG: hypothetical protein R3C58_06790 [Parvularculaceae bacterium]